MKTIQNKKGFSLSELMMVVLILGLTVVVIGSGINVVKDAYTKITLKAEAQSLMSTSITKISDEFRYASEITNTVDSILFLSGNKGYKIFFTNDSSKGIMMNSQVSGGTPAPLISDKANTSGLVSKLVTTNYDKEVITGTVKIFYKNKEFMSQKIVVRPVNN